MTLDVAIVDYGMGNLRSVHNALRFVAPDARIEITSDAQDVHDARRVVVPGQAAMPDTMAALNASGLREAVIAAANSKPFLGICLGLQMLFDVSEEGPTPCLGVYRGTVVRFDPAKMTDAQGQRQKVPHMGWSPVRQARAHPLWAGIADHTRFYFAHSYYPVPREMDLVTGLVAYPDAREPFTCAIGRATLFAVQFHPEKSSTAGLRLLSNFVSWNA
ncbi:MAG: imidazole glycerol phosphate synthase subunit HisH [Betaproteobacteria bacterium]|nr:imidazole glycerol phosphate synthase subunit HisH [Betaproteobacteria bacterium]